VSLYRGSGVYAFRTRRPGLIGRLPAWLAPAAGLISLAALNILGYPLWPAALALLFYPRHWSYVGETTAMELRRVQHLVGGGKFQAVAKPWADLEPAHYFLRTPWASKRMLRFIETLGILLLWPVYNHKKNLWNPRRITLEAARVQRRMRDYAGWSLNVTPVHIAMIIGGVLAWIMR
jgi:hypothetical protein